MGSNEVKPECFKKGFFYLHRDRFALFGKEGSIFNARLAFHRVFHGQGSPVRLSLN